jgi:hypothetical protein
VILLALFVVGAIVALANALLGPTNGVAVIGILLMAPAVARGLTHDLYVYIPTLRKKTRS